MGLVSFIMHHLTLCIRSTLLILLLLAIKTCASFTYGHTQLGVRCIGLVLPRLFLGDVVHSFFYIIIIQNFKHDAILQQCHFLVFGIALLFADV